MEIEKFKVTIAFTAEDAKTDWCEVLQSAVWDLSRNVAIEVEEIER